MRRQTAIFIYLLAFYVLLQFAWWAYHIIELTSSINNEPDYISKRTVMILGEGAVFFSIVILAIIQIRKSILKDIELSRQQKNFLLAVTHELKTPIASVKLYLQTLKRHQLDETKRLEIADNALAENDRLQQIIENILSVSQIENQSIHIHLESVNLKDSIDDALKAPRMQNACEIAVSCREDLFLKLDSNAWHSVLSNLIDNALKYAGDNPRITLSCEENNGLVQIIFEDNGPGVPNDKLDVIFQRFARLGHEETRSAKGVGLGLYIVKQLVQAMQGSIQAENIKPCGLRFIMHFKNV